MWIIYATGLVNGIKCVTALKYPQFDTEELAREYIQTKLGYLVATHNYMFFPVWVRLEEEFR